MPTEFITMPATGDKSKLVVMQFGFDEERAV